MCSEMLLNSSNVSVEASTEERRPPEASGGNGSKDGIGKTIERFWNNNKERQKQQFLGTILFTFTSIILCLRKYKTSITLFAHEFI